METLFVNRQKLGENQGEKFFAIQSLSLRQPRNLERILKNHEDFCGMSRLHSKLRTFYAIKDRRSDLDILKRHFKGVISK